MKRSKVVTKHKFTLSEKRASRRKKTINEPPTAMSHRTTSWPEIMQEGSGTAIYKAAKLLQALVAADGSQLVDLANKISMPKPSVHRLIQQLEEVGLVQRDLEGKGFTVGPALLKLAVDSLAAVTRRPPIRNLMRDLVDRIQESCNLAIQHDHEVLYLERVECNFPLRMQLQAGSRVPIHCTAAGKLFLSQMSAAKRARVLHSIRLDRYTANTITDTDELEAECLRIRETGVSINKEEFHVGLIGVAVPILSSDKTPMAALAIHAPIFRMSVDAAQAQIPLLQKTAAKISTEYDFGKS